MSVPATVAHFDHIADLLDRACVVAPNDPGELASLLEQAECSIAAGDNTCRSAESPSSASPIWRAVQRVRSSHATLVRVIEEEAARLEDQLASLSQQHHAVVSYGGAEVGSLSRFDRVG